MWYLSCQYLIFCRSGLEHDDMKIFYNYLTTSLFPAHFSTSDIQVCNVWYRYLYGGVYFCYDIVAKWSNSFSVCYTCSYHSEPPRWLVSPKTLYFSFPTTGMLLLCSFLLGQNSRQSTELTGKSTTVFVTMDGKLISCRLYIYHVSYLQLSVQWRRKLC